MNNNEITAILNCYRRPWSFEEQYNSIQNQTIKPKDILVWKNYYSDTANSFSKDVLNLCKVADCNSNFGVWSRFAYALNAKTKYICVFDDDTIPGSRWFENCLQTINAVDGLLGARGVISLINSNNITNNIETNSAISNAATSSIYPVAPWGYNTENITKVDFVGHCWFFERDWLQAYWRELPPPEYFSAGEDIHFSYTLQKYLNKNTYVPAQPRNDTSLWGSIKAIQYGDGPEATSNFCSPEINKYFKHVVTNGFKLLNG
jgi:GT2 family glycosyltransferase